MIRALVINAGPATARMAFQTAQLNALGIPFERLQAVIPEAVMPHPGDPYWSRWERPMTGVEKAILCSHRAAWEMVARGRGPMLILEDDVLLAAPVPKFLKSAERLEGVGRITLEVRSRPKRVGGANDARLPARTLYQDRTGAAAYVLWPTGAQALLRRAARRPGLSDAILCAAYEVPSLQAWPALAIQLDQCAAYGVEPPVATETTNPQKGRSERGPSTPRQVLRRLAGQARMGLRAINTFGVARKRRVPLCDDWPPIEMVAAKR